MTEERKSPWNSLEVAKLLVTPLVVALLGFFVQTQIAAQGQATQTLLAEQARSWQQSQRLVDRRLQVYESVRLELNKIYCFVEDVGSWKEDNPETVISYKRAVDREMHSHRAIWSNETFDAYLKYIDSAFGEYQGGVGKDAPIATTADQKREGIKNWSPSWETRLTGKRDPQHKVKYDQLLNRMSQDMNTKSVG
nr:hypothetical protein [uncultured Albidiferax sp.]